MIPRPGYKRSSAVTNEHTEKKTKGDAKNNQDDTRQITPSQVSVALPGQFIRLPYALVQLLIKYLNLPSVVSLAHVNKFFRNESKKNYIWEEMFRYYFPMERRLVYAQSQLSKVNLRQEFWQIHQDDYRKLKPLLKLVKKGDFLGFQAECKKFTLEALTYCRDGKGNNLFYWTSFYRLQPFLTLLYKKAVQEEKNQITLLHWASTCNQLNAVKALLAKVDIDAQHNKSGNTTPLFQAACHGHVDVCQLLLQNKANPNAARTDRVTPLHMAAHNGHTEIVKLLWGARADAEVFDRHGRTSLYLAAQNGYTEIVDFLLDNEVDPKVACSDGKTPLYIAARNGHTEIVDFLLDKKAEPMAVCRFDGATPLHVAAQNDRTEIVSFLLEAKADPLVTDKKGVTPLGIAQQRNHQDIVKCMQAPAEKAKPLTSDTATQTDHPFGFFSSATSGQQSASQTSASAAVALFPTQTSHNIAFN